MLRQLADSLWVAEQPHRYLGFDLVTRMTVLRLADGALWVHSPIRLSDELRSIVDSSGPVRYVVSPNRFHHVFVTDWQRAYPDAQTFGAPGLETKRSDV